MIQIVPAIMPRSFKDLEHSLSAVSGVAPLVQVDIMDGIYTESSTWPYATGDSIADFVSGESELPYLDSIDFEIDLMVRDPLIQAQDWISAGASRVVVHMGSVDDYVDVITKLYSMYAMPGNLIQTDIIVAVPFDVHIEQIRPIATCISGIQIMGISPVGVQGSALRPEVYATIKTIHSTFPSIPLSVDGGVKEPLIEKLVAAGASYIVMGSAIFGHEHPRGVLRDLCNTYNSV